MKLYKLLTIVLFMSLMACEEDGTNTVISGDLIAPVVTSPAADAAITVTEENMENEVTVTWEEADYGVDLAVTYIVQLDFVDNLFAAPAIIGTTQENTITVTNSALNDMVIGDLGQNPNEATQVELRVVAKTTGFNDLNSDITTVSFTTFQASGVPPVIVAPAAVVITESILGDPYTIGWSAANFGSSSAVTYKVEASVEGSDVKALLGSTTGTSMIIDHSALNFYLVGNLGQANNTEVAVQYTVTAISATNTLVSEVVSSNVTTLNAVQPSVLWTPGSYQDWNPSIASVINHVSDAYYDGFIYFNVDAGFKFTNAPDWDHTNFGLDEATTPEEGVTAVLTKDDDANGMSITAGYYRCQVDTTALTFIATKVESFGLIGTATVGGWDSSTPMTYDEATDTWRATADLIIGALKFRANDGWGINYGMNNIDSRRGQLVFDGGSYDVKADGNYTVILSFNTDSTPYQFNYEIIKN